MSRNDKNGILTLTDDLISQEFIGYEKTVDGQN
jgi:hypothetical protein